MFAVLFFLVTSICVTNVCFNSSMLKKKKKRKKEKKERKIKRKKNIKFFLLFIQDFLTLYLEGYNWTLTKLTKGKKQNRRITLTLVSRSSIAMQYTLHYFANLSLSSYFQTYALCRLTLSRVSTRKSSTC